MIPHLSSLKIASYLNTFTAIIGTSPNLQKPCKQGMATSTNKSSLNPDPQKLKVGWSIQKCRHKGPLASEVKICSRYVIPPSLAVCGLVCQVFFPSVSRCCCICVLKGVADLDLNNLFLESSNYDITP